MSERDLLAEIEDALEQIEDLLFTEEQAWQQDTPRQLSVERLWILAGNASERYRRSRSRRPQAGSRRPRRGPIPSAPSP